jgi:D-glycero-alpha-D-manno-heptose-7-phosphate kinase
MNGEQPAIEVHTYCEAPPGSGLGSSSTLVVAVVQALQELYRLPLGEYEVAHLAFEIERIDEGLAGGRQDQYAAAFGGVNFIEFFPDDRVVVNPLRISESMRRELEASLVTYFTGVSRESAAIIKRQAAAVGARESLVIEATHAVKREAAAMKEALLKGNLVRLAECLNAGWEAKRTMAVGISNERLDMIYRTALAAGALGGKVSGAGGGGFMMFLTDPARRPAVLRALVEFGGIAGQEQLCLDGAVAWRVRG